MHAFTKNSRTHRGTSSLEILVAFSLLTTVMGVAMPLVVRHGRLLTAQREYRIALDELENQLDRLTALPETELSAAIKQLSPSEFVAARLHDAMLTGEITREEIGSRIMLRLSWDETHRREAPVMLSGWVFSTSTEEEP